MKLSFLKKKKSITLDEIHEKGISPRQDWAKMLIGLFVFLALSAIYSAFLFFNLLKGEDSLPREFTSFENRPTLDKSKLDSAVEFITALKSD